MATHRVEAIITLPFYAAFRTDVQSSEGVLKQHSWPCIVCPSGIWPGGDWSAALDHAWYAAAGSAESGKPAIIDIVMEPRRV
jgi:hypothetical protein